MKKIFLTSLALTLAACGGSSDSSGGSDDQTAGINFEISEPSTSNDSIYDAQPINLGTRISGSAGPSDLYDFYQFAVAEGQTVQINLTGGSSSDLDIALWGEGGLLDYSEGFESTEEIIFTAESTGTYYLSVSYYDGNASNYELIILGDEVSVQVVTDEAAFCLENIVNGVSYFTVASSEDLTGNLFPGSCPTSGYVSECGVTYITGEIINTYFTQNYVDVVGGHTEVEEDVCDLFSDESTTSIYTIY
jgi:hypothetical protein